MVAECTVLFEQSMEALMSLHEDPNLKRLNTKVREFQQQYNEARATVCTVAITQRLAKLQEAK